MRQMHREELIELLWPDVSPDLGLNNLHKALLVARRAIEPALAAGGHSKFLQMRDQLVILQGGDDVSVDVSEFDALADEALKTGEKTRIEVALAIYQADLLPEDLYEDWAAVRRVQLRSQKEQLLLRLASVCETSGDTAGAIQAYKQLIASNPCNEVAFRSLMKLHVAAGQRHLAVQQFRTSAEVLRRELDAEPEPATVALYEQILAGAGEPNVARGETLGAAVPPPATPVASQAAAIQASPAVAQGMGKKLRGLWYAAAAMGLLCLTAMFLYLSWRTPEPIKSVAIMPLATAADSPELDYVADGITESVINNLSQLRQVRVMSRSTVYSYRAKGLDPMTAAAAMKVQAVLLGTISKRGGNLLLSAELVGVPEGTRLWGTQYELTAKDLISVQDRIAAEITTSLGLRLSNVDRANLSAPHTADPEAYRLYIQARYFWNRRSKEGYLKSIELFQSAIARDPAYARAYAGLADSYSFLGRDEAPTHEYMYRARVAAEKALAIDEKLAEAHASLGMMNNVYEWNFPAAQREFRRALELDPNYPNTHLFYGVFLAARGISKRRSQSWTKRGGLTHCRRLLRCAADILRALPGTWGRLSRRLRTH